MSIGTRRHLRLDRAGDVAVVSFLVSKIITEEDIREIGDQLDALVEADGHRRFLLNFRTVQALDTTFLFKLIAFKKKVSAVQGDLKLCDIDPFLLAVFTITRLDRVFPIFADEAEALGTF